MRMRPSDKDIEREIREAEKYHETAHRGPAVDAVIGVAKFYSSLWIRAIERSLPARRGTAPMWSSIATPDGLLLAAPLAQNRAPFPEEPLDRRTWRNPHNELRLTLC
jgi:hypothetical protein